MQSDSAEVPAEARQKRRLALLAVLAVAGEKGISREKLQAFLWAESSSERSRHALDQLLYATRRALGADPFIADGRELRLDPSVVTSDLAQFEQAVAKKVWTAAAALYGGPLLDGFQLSSEGELESWIETERTRLRLAYERALETLAHDAALIGEAVLAANWWRKLSMSDPLSSRIALQTAKAIAATGDCAGAVQYARAFQKSVRSQLGIEPDASIDKLIGQLAPKSAVTIPDATSQARKSSAVSSGAGLAVDKDNAAHASVATESSDAKSIGHVRSWRWAGLAVSLLIAVIAVASAANNKSSSVARGATSHRAPGPIDPRARLSYLRGLNAWSDRSKEGLDTAVIYFRRATEIDPTYAEAYAGLANAYVLLGYSGYRSANAMFPKSKAAALRSMELDSTLAAPHAALAHKLMWERDFARSEAEFRKAIALDPAYATAHQWYSMLMMMLGRTEEAVAESGRAAQLDALSLQIQNTLAGVYAANGHYTKAISTAQRAIDIVHNHPRAVSSLASVYIWMKKPEMARKIFARADTTNEQYSAYKGLMYARLGEVDSAFFWLDRVQNWSIPIMIGLRDDRLLAPIRTDPRYAALLERLGLSAK